MKNFSDNNIKRKHRKLVVELLIGITFFICAGLCLAWRFSIINKYDSNIKDLNEIITNNDTKLTQAFLNAKSIPLEFAYYNSKGSFYIVSDGDYLYTVYMNDDDYNKLNTESIYNNPIKVYGYTSKVNNSIKKSAIKAYNSKVTNDLDKLTLDDYDSYFGKVYLNMELSNTDITLVQSYLFLFFILFGGIIFVISLLKLLQFNSSLRDYNNEELKIIDSEINSKNSISYDKLYLYLTDNYIINYKNKLNAVKYSDLLWIYPIVQKNNGINSSQSIKGVSRNGKTFLIATVKFSGTNNKNVYDEIWKKIVERNKDLLVGYTKDNIQLVNKLIKK